MLSPAATAYDAKCRAVDAESLPCVVSETGGADLLHIYGPLPKAAVLRKLGIPYLAESEPISSRLPWRAAPSPAAIVRREQLPEAVERRYRDATVLAYRGAASHQIGSFVGSRPGVANIVDQTLARIHRFRDDIEWLRLDRPPEPEELRSLDLWVDPVVQEEDHDGFVAEAIVSGCLVVAGRTKANAQRAADGRAAFLVPPGDPNETAHAIFNALFKPEQSEPRRAAMPSAAARFDAGVRARALTEIYEKVLGG